jgi:hypothetical protein
LNNSNEGTQAEFSVSLICIAKNAEYMRGFAGDLGDCIQDLEQNQAKNNRIRRW